MLVTDDEHFHRPSDHGNRVFVVAAEFGPPNVFQLLDGGSIVICCVPMSMCLYGRHMGDWKPGVTDVLRFLSEWVLYVTHVPFRCNHHHHFQQQVFLDRYVTACDIGSPVCGVAGIDVAVATL